MTEELAPYFLENYKIVDISTAWYFISATSDDYESINDYNLDLITRSISVPVSFIKTNRKKIHNEPLELIEEYYKQRPIDFGDDLYESGSFYNEYHRFKNKYTSNEYLNLHLTTDFFSTISEMHYLSKIKMRIELSDNFKVSYVHIGNLHFQKNNDFMAKTLFDDVSYLHENLSEDFLQKVFIKFLQS